MSLSFCSRHLGRPLQTVVSILLSRQTGAKPLSGLHVLHRQLAVPARSCSAAAAAPHPAPALQRHRQLDRPHRSPRLHAAAAMTEQTPATEPAAELAAAEEPPAAAATAAGSPAAASVDGGYEAQLAGKVERVRQLFSDFQLPEVEIFRSSPDHYRLRCTV